MLEIMGNLRTKRAMVF